MTITSVVGRSAVALAVLVAFEAGPLRSQESGGGAKAQELALKTAETIEFTTDEVTWMSVAVSPDGRTIVFDLLGDLYTLPIDGGTATRIIGGLSFESQPTWSPDGKPIAFLSDRTGVENLWIAERRRLEPARGQQGRAAPTIGRRSWCRRRGRRTASTSSCRSRGRPSRARSGCSCITATAAPAFASARRRRRSPRPTPAVRRRRRRPTGWARWSRPTAASSTTRSAPAPSPTTRASRCGRSTATIARPATSRRSPTRRAARCGPVLSPDGKWLVYGTRHKTETGLRVRNLETGAERWLAYPVTRDDQESRASRDTLPALRLHARRQVADRADRRQAAAHRLRDRRSARRFRSRRRCRPRSRRASTRRCAWTTARPCARG